VLVKLHFRIDGGDAGVALSGYVPERGMVLDLENTLVAGHARVVVLWTQGTFSAKGFPTPGGMRIGPVYVHVRRVPDDYAPPDSLRP
jgi:hypothetical protein